MPLFSLIHLENLNWFWLVVGALATWRLTSVLFWEKAGKPVRWLVGIRETEDDLVYPPGLLGALFRCFWCLSFWCGLVVLAVVLVFPWPLIALAYSALAIFTDSWHDKLRE